MADGAGADPPDPNQLRIERYHAAFPEADVDAIAAHLAVVSTGTALAQHTSRHLVAGFDVNPARYSLLRALYFSPEGRLPQNEVAREMGTSQPNVTQLLDALERDGLVERVTSEVDRRVTYASLTPAGERKCAGMVPDMVKFMEQSVAGFTGEEMVQLRRLLAKLRAHIEALAGNEA
jgi:MarR family 2-MHQ and catechol resistance regulon transcriptional repressor